MSRGSTKGWLAYGESTFDGTSSPEESSDSELSDGVAGWGVVDGTSARAAVPGPEAFAGVATIGLRALFEA